MLEDRDDEQQRYEEQVQEKVLSAETLRAPLLDLGIRRPHCVTLKTPVGAAIQLMQQQHIGAVLVTDEAGKLAGIFTERDVLLKVAGKRLDFATVPVSEVMTANPETLQQRDNVAYALNYMHMGGYRHVPIVDEQGTPVTIVSIKDVVAYLADFFQQEVTNLPPEPVREGPDHRYGA